MFRGGQPAVFFDTAHESATNSDTRAGSSPNERVLIMGLPGLLLTSASGAKIHGTPAAFASSAVILPWCRHFRVARRGDSHGMRERHAFVNAHGRAALEIAAISSGTWRGFAAC